jgi:hypothetical protein
MVDPRMERLTRYLMSLAPEHFGAGIEPATEEDLARLEAVAGRPIIGYHRQFLLTMGNTKPGALDPFLNGRVFNVDELCRAYPDLEGYGLGLAPEISIFSAPEAFGDFEFIRTHEDLAIEQEFGILDFETGRFLPDSVGTLENWVLKFAFTFRVGQLDHVRGFVPRRRWEPGPCLEVLARKNLGLVFEFPDGTRCYEGGPWAVVVHHDGSGHAASDDRVALLDLCGALEDLADTEIQPRPRLAAPKR